MVMTVAQIETTRRFSLPLPNGRREEILRLLYPEMITAIVTSNLSALDVRGPKS